MEKAKREVIRGTAFSRVWRFASERINFECPIRALVADSDGEVWFAVADLQRAARFTVGQVSVGRRYWGEAYDTFPVAELPSTFTYTPRTRAMFVTRCPDTTIPATAEAMRLPNGLRAHIKGDPVTYVDYLRALRKFLQEMESDLKGAANAPNPTAVAPAPTLAEVVDKAVKTLDESPIDALMAPSPEPVPEKPAPSAEGLANLKVLGTFRVAFILAKRTMDSGPAMRWANEYTRRAHGLDVLKLFFGSDAEAMCA